MVGVKAPLRKWRFRLRVSRSCRVKRKWNSLPSWGNSVCKGLELRRNFVQTRKERRAAQLEHRRQVGEQQVAWGAWYVHPGSLPSSTPQYPCYSWIQKLEGDLSLFFSKPKVRSAACLVDLCGMLWASWAQTTYSLPSKLTISHHFCSSSPGHFLFLKCDLSFLWSLITLPALLRHVTMFCSVCLYLHACLICKPCKGRFYICFIC